VVDEMKSMCERIASLINEGDEVLISDFLEQHERRLAHPSHVRCLIESPTQMGRLEALLLTLQEFAFGADTLTALSLSKSLLGYLNNHLDRLPGKRSALLHFYASAISCAVYANLQEGNWDLALSLTSQPAQDVPQLTAHPLYWNALGTQARMLVRRNAIAEARAILERAPQEFFGQDNQLASAKNELDHFVQRRFEVDSRPTVAEQTSAIWKRDIPGMRMSMAKLRQLDIIRARSAKVEPMTTFFDQVIDSLAGAERMIDADMPFERKRLALAQVTYEFQEALRRYQSPSGDFDRVTFDWVNRLFHRVMAFYNREGVGGEAHHLLYECDLAQRWTQKAGDIHSQWLINWARLLILSDASRPAESVQPLQEMLVHLRDARAKVSELAVKSDIANFFPDLPRRALELPEHPARVNHVADAFELRRGRSLVAAAAERPGLVRLSQAKTNSLGRNVHYIGFTSIHTSREIHAVLYCADGTLLHEFIELPLDKVYQQIPRLDPSEWSRPNLFGRPTYTPPEVLSPLLSPLAKGLNAGHIKEGDHVCIAAEDPLHLIPFQYIRLQNSPAIRWVSMSRCTSFADAFQLAHSEYQFPRTAGAIFVAPADEKDPRTKHLAFSRVVAALTASLRTQTIDHSTISKAHVLDAINQFDLIHVDAHGAFDPNQNPWEFSGLLIGDSQGPPVRDGQPHRLLTPQQIHDSGVSTKARDICLNACVSGQGIPGKGGDVLGMEFALRLTGASCVLASHWNLEWAKTSFFFVEYYARWLGKRMSRSQAWRESILSLIEQNGSSIVPEAWTAFSLFGSWR